MKKEVWIFYKKILHEPSETLLYTCYLITSATAFLFKFYLFWFIYVIIKWGIDFWEETPTKINVAQLLKLWSCVESYMWPSLSGEEGSMAVEGENMFAVREIIIAKGQHIEGPIKKYKKWN